ncbi:integrase catalytic domain-containing protein [Trichonephila clavipes]|nr:integrase catalytic domain-containing protein [Trichonephila clavipes]
MELKTFVQNRIAKIQDLFPVRQWRHVPSNQNPADLISRGVDSDKLLNQELWWNGPEFLSGSDYPNKTVKISENNDAYNSEQKNRVLSFVNNARRKVKTNGPLEADELDKAEIFLIKGVQSQKFSVDIKYLQQQVLPKSKLKSLNPFLDSDGVLRVGGRLGANREIKKLHEMVRKPDDELARYLAAEGIKWKFIPPRSANFGGLWEAAIKSFKYHLKRVMRGINLTYDEFLTVIDQIEGMLNFRPLCPLSANENDFKVLTPAHFLINRSLNSIIELNVINIKESYLKKEMGKN